MVPFECFGIPYGCMFAFRSNYGRIFSRFGTICERDTPSLTPHDIEPRDAASLDCSRAAKMHISLFANSGGSVCDCHRAGDAT